MKFSVVDVADRSDKPLAYLDDEGDLVFLDVNDDDSVVITEGGTVIHRSDEDDLSYAKRLFYPGDTLTITF